MGRVDVCDNDNNDDDDECLDDRHGDGNHAQTAEFHPAAVDPAA